MVRAVKLYERLGIQRFVSLQHLAMLRTSENYSPSSDFERAWEKFNRANLKGLVALNFYFMDERQLAKQHATACLKDGDEFLFGAWRSQFKTPEGNVDARWWKENIDWIDIFELSLLWGAALGEWGFLRRVSEFPDETARLTTDRTPEDRDSLFAIALLLRGESGKKCRHYLDRMSAGPNKGAKLLAEALKALLDADAERLVKDLTAYLHHYKAEEFLKERITKKISIEGTLIVHWGLHESMAVEVPRAFQDYIVDLTLQRTE